ncbi:MAG: hypothetical protein KJ702_02230 [Gammaproteobacteria bacterium]|nr:hypothetical protein [Gammaproteobacteria bacterium]
MNAKRTTKPSKPTKLFVLDTNVLMHDPLSLFRFEEHDLYVPMMTLEELDANKKGMSEVARNARQTSRMLDEIVSCCEDRIKHGIELAGPSHDLATGRLFLQTEAINSVLPASLPTSRADNQIIAVAMHLHQTQPKRPVILVTKDINMRIKARALGLDAQDYFNDKVLEDTDLLYTGSTELPEDFWDTHGKGLESWKKDGRTYYRIKGPLCPDLSLEKRVLASRPGALPSSARDLLSQQSAALHSYLCTHPEVVMDIARKIESSETRITKAVFPNTTNHYATLFGGTALQWMDEAAFITATRFSRQKIVTVCSDRIDFKTPIPAGTFVELVGRVVNVGNTSIQVQVTVYLEQMYDTTREKAIEGLFTFVAVDDAMRPIQVIK